MPKPFRLPVILAALLALGACSTIERTWDEWFGPDYAEMQDVETMNSGTR